MWKMAEKTLKNERVIILTMEMKKVSLVQKTYFKSVKKGFLSRVRD